MPEYTIYENDYPIGQAKTWYKALAILLESKALNDISLELFNGGELVQVKDNLTGRYYRINKTRRQ